MAPGGFSFSDEFTTLVEELMTEHHVPGLTIATVHKGFVLSAGYGKASLDPPRPCTPDTLFDVASCSKSMTAASVALLVDDDENYPEVQYDAIVSKLLPGDFIMPDAGYTENINVEDLLCHRTGMSGHDLSYFGPRAAKPDNKRSLTRNLRNLHMAAPLRSKFMYNNMMFSVAAYLVEIKSKKPFAEFLQQRFFTPLGMDSTCLQPSQARERGFADRIAKGYAWKDSSYHGWDVPDAPEGEGAGCIVSSANDFIKWVKALLSQEGPITAKIYNDLVRMRIPMNDEDEDETPYMSPTIAAAGLMVFFYRGFMVVSHGGTVPGAKSRFFFVPMLELGGFIFGNAEGAGDIADKLVVEIIDEVLQVPTNDRAAHNKSGTSDTSGLNESKDTGKPESDDAQTTNDSIDAKSTDGIGLLPTAFVGTYSHPGYRTLDMQLKNDKLFIDATDRGFGFTLTIELPSGGKGYDVRISDYFEGGDYPLKAEFQVEGGQVNKMGLELDWAYGDLIWFDKV